MADLDDSILEDQCIELSFDEEYGGGANVVLVDLHPPPSSSAPSSPSDDDDDGNFTAQQRHYHGGMADLNPYQVRQRDDDEEASVEEESDQELHESKILPVADLTRCSGEGRGELMAAMRYPSSTDIPVEAAATLATATQQEDAADATGTTAKAERPHSIIGSAIESLKYLYSTVLLIFSVVVVTGAMFTEQTIATGEGNLPPAAAFVIFWFLIAWLSVMEGGQGCLVGLQPVDKSKFADTHPRTLRNTTLVHKGGNMERFIIGRQFLVVLAVFVTNLMASSVDNATLFNLPEQVTTVFLESGVAVILVTITLGQLTAQVNAASCMLDFVNNYFMLFTVYVSMFIEFTGLLHSVYLVQTFFAMVSGTSVKSEESPRGVLRRLWFWSQVLVSVALLGFAFAATLAALFQGQTTMWDGVPGSVSVVLLLLLMCFVGLMEGMQVRREYELGTFYLFISSTSKYRTFQCYEDPLLTFLMFVNICLPDCSFRRYQGF